MKNKNFFVATLAIASILGLGAAGLTSAHLSKAQKVVAATEAAVVPSFDGEQLLTSDKSLTITATSGTSTDYGASYEVKFSTGADALIDTGRIFNVTNEDGTLIEVNAEIAKMTPEEKEALQIKLDAGEVETTMIDDCFIYSFENTKTEITIPRTISRGNPNHVPFFTGNINAIASNAMAKNTKTKTLYIPNTITTIPDDAFAGNSSIKKFCVEFAESEIPEGWVEGWNRGIEVEYGVNVYDPSSSRKNAAAVKTNSTNTIGDPNINYIIGYWPSQGGIEKFPLYVEYKVEGDNNPRFKALGKTIANQDYDGVGKRIYGFNNTLTFDIDVNKGEKIDFESIVIHNIFAAQRVEEETSTYYVPIQTERYYAMPHKAFGETYDISQFLDIHFKRATAFAGYTSISANVAKVDNGKVYKLLRPSLYNNYKSKLDSGEAYIRYRFTSLTTSKYRVIFNDQDIVSKVDTPVSQFIIEKDISVLSFVFKNGNIGHGFKNTSLKAFALNNAVVTLDIVVNGTIISRTAAHTRFGSIYFLEEDENLKTFNSDLLIILLAVGYSAGAFALATFLFFLYKRIFKNDEFRRLKPKQFVKKGIIYWLTSLELALTLTFVILRSTAFNNAVVVYNPFDIFIVLFAIAAIIIIGYYVKTIVTITKANNQKKRAAKLGLNDDVDDDGTN